MRIPVPAISAAIVVAALALPAAVQARPTSSRFTVVVSVNPSIMPHNAYPTLKIHTRIGSTCTATITYDDGRAPTSFSGYAQHVGTSGIVRWYWHEETRSDGGMATVTCMHAGQTATSSAGFSVY